jgi:hypothetical protein
VVKVLDTTFDVAELLELERAKDKGHCKGRESGDESYATLDQRAARQESSVGRLEDRRVEISLVTRQEITSKSCPSENCEPGWEQRI